DGWVWVLEDFVTNEGIGGSHKFLEAGSQIVLIPMLGNPQQLLMIGCIHSRRDRPNPLFNRAKGVYGTHTPGEVMSIRDDRKAERTDGYPNGVIQQVSSAGDVINQTQGGARSHLQADGTINIENPLASAVISADGDVTHSSAGGAVSILGAEGEAIIRSEAFGSELNLAAIESTLTAPIPAIGALMNQAKQITGSLGEGLTLFSELNQRFELGLDNQLSHVANTLQTLNKGIGTAAEQGMNVLGKLQEFSAEDFGKLLSNQVEQALDPAIATLTNGLPGILEDFEFSRINEFLKEQNLNILPDNIEPILHGLSHQPSLQLEMILSEVLPDGYDSFANLSALGLHGAVGQIKELIDSLDDYLTVMQNEGLPATELDRINIDRAAIQLSDGIQQAWKLLPATIQTHLDQAEFTGLARNVVAGDLEIGDLFVSVLGQRAKGAIANAAEALGRSIPILDKVPQLSRLTAGLMSGDTAIAREIIPQLGEGFAGLENTSPSQLLEQVMGQFSGQLTPVLEDALGTLNQSFQSIPNALPTPRVVANAVMSELRSATGTSKVFASDAGAGLNTPWGGFSIGSGGFSFKGKKGKDGKQQPLVLPVTGNHNARIKIDENQGILIEGTTPEGQVLSKVLVDGSKILLTAGENATIELNPSGVYINGVLWTGTFSSNQ
ncbi:MAG: hypothetical protein HC781_19195, partial [Leptolyngbyaceae cyanobacterium CSU_1_4]|nr:hypothetical protein [Leptolyngbyaceae cyanobacterium CSU_1_4]